MTHVATRRRPSPEPGDGALADTIIALVRGGRGLRHTIGRAVRVVRTVVTPTGWAVIAATAVAFIAGYVLGWEELVVVAWALAALLAVAALHLAGRSAHTVRLDLPVTRVVVGERAPGGVDVRNPTRRRLPGVNVEVPVGDRVARFAMPALARETNAEEIFVVPTSRRGVIPIGPVRTVRADPIGLVRRELVWAERVSLFVHPRTISIPSLSSGYVRDLEGSPTRDLTASDVSFHALREYVAGDERRHIHWRSTAKTGTFMVRQFEETRRSQILVILDLDPDDYADDDEFELAVSAVGSLGTRAIRDGRDVEVVVPASTPAFARRRVLRITHLSTVSRDRLLDELCTVDVDSAALPLGDTARIAAESAIGVSLAFVVTGSVAGLVRVRSAAAHFPAGVEVIGVLCEPEASPSSRRVSGLSLLTIGYLEDLRAILARSAAVG